MYSIHLKFVHDTALLDSPSLASLQEKETVMDLLRPARRKEAAREERRRRAGERKESRAGRSCLVGNYRDVGSTGTARSLRFSGYQNCQVIVPMEKCQV